MARFTDAQQRKECHIRFDASVGVHSQSLGHRHVGNPATASVAQTLFAIPVCQKKNKEAREKEIIKNLKK